MTQNLLKTQVSPYLLQHKDNPVHWMPWGLEALELAQKENKPILLSIGYAACHWCHVMAHESFEDIATAKVMNGLFVNIKVDREERPDIDDIYMNALQMLGQQGGWPLTMFLTPQGEPFWGGTYFPKTARAGMPAFMDLCQEISRLFKQENDKVQSNAAQLTQAISQRSQMTARAQVLKEFPLEAAQALHRYMDTVNGGMQGQPKFPQAFVFQYIWETGYLNQLDDLKQAAHLTALKIGAGGVYDHLGGGWSRYSVDERWCVPHFEKMLYDNALLIDFYSILWRDSPNPLYLNRIETTINWLIRDMVLPEGGFGASLDADTQGIEGKFYVWGEDEVKDILQKDAASFMSYYDISVHGNFEGVNVLNTLLKHDAEKEAQFAPARKALYNRRATRTHPALDDKVLADWNGLMIGALARAALIFKRAQWQELAVKAYDFIKQNMTYHQGGYKRLTHARRKNISSPHDTAEDYANITDAALALYSATGHQIYLEDAISFMASLEKYFSCKESGGYFMTASDAQAILMRPRHARDNALPNANGTLIWVLSRLEAFTGEQNYGRRAEELAMSFGLHTVKEFAQMTTTLASLAKHHKSISCVITGEKSDLKTKKLLQTAYQHPHPACVVQPLFTAQELNPSHPAYKLLLEKKDNNPRAYICLNQMCLAPIEEPDMLKQKLDNL